MSSQDLLCWLSYSSKRENVPKKAKTFLQIKNKEADVVPLDIKITYNKNF